MARSHRLGRRGEALAAAYLEARGWRILERSFRSGHREIDLIAAREGVVIFVEVKTRGGTGLGHPLEGITRKQRGEIAAVARAWIGARSGAVRRPSFPPPGAAGSSRLDGPTTFRFDAIAIVIEPGRPPKIEHLEDAWRIGF
ncbi:MAG: YraN family protein [Gemmatimonadota bacterium]